MPVGRFLAPCGRGPPPHGRTNFWRRRMDFWCGKTDFRCGRMDFRCRQDGFPVRQDGFPVRQNGSPVRQDGSPVREKGAATPAGDSAVREKGAAARQEECGMPLKGPAAWPDRAHAWRWKGRGREMAVTGPAKHLAATDTARAGPAYQPRSLRAGELWYMVETFACIGLPEPRAFVTRFGELFSAARRNTPHCPGRTGPESPGK